MFYLLEFYVDNIANLAKTILEVFLACVFRKAANINLIGLHGEHNSEYQVRDEAKELESRCTR